MAPLSATSSGSSLSAPKNKRKAITDTERLAIRKRHKEHPSKQSDLAKWFSNETGHAIDQAQVSKILSSTYAHLDGLDLKKDKKALNLKRTSAGDWPDLEAALFEWQQRMQKSKAIITGEILKDKASKLWKSLPQYADVEEPKWSNGWIQNFKRRYKIKEYVMHGEAGSAAIDDPDSQQQMENLRALVATYECRNVLNMDETGCFWKQSPNRSLATEAQAGGKKAKDRVTLALTSNADGSEKMAVWLIGKSKNPQCLKNIDRRNLRVQYRHNKSKWMTGMICEEYLRWLDNKMRGEGRHVLLILDNFSGHELAVTLVGGKQGLSNVRIEWLPPNTTSHWQPMDQGIIASFKTKYRKRWVEFMIREYEKGRDPNKTVTLLKAIQWSRWAWENSLTKETIQRCWVKSTLIKKPEGLEPVIDDDLGAERAELQEYINALPPPAAGQERIPLNEFINPDNETILDDDPDIFATVVERYSEVQEDDESDRENGEEEVELEKVPVSKAFDALETLRLFKLQQEDTPQETLRALDQIEGELAAVRVSTRKQTTINSFFKRK